MMHRLLRRRVLLTLVSVVGILLTVGLTLGLGTHTRAHAFDGQRVFVDENVAAFQALPGNEFDTTIYVEGTDHKLWRDRATNAHRTLVDSNVASFQALDATTVYVEGTDGKLWRETGDGTHRTPVDSNVNQFQALDSNWVYVQKSDRTLWIDNGDASNSQQVAVNVLAFQGVDPQTSYSFAIDTAGTADLQLETNSGENLTPILFGDGGYFQAFGTDGVYVRETSGALWFLTLNSVFVNFHIDDQVLVFQALDFHTVYVEGTDHNLWREYDGAAHRTFVDNSVLAFQALNFNYFYVEGTDHKLWEEGLNN